MRFYQVTAIFYFHFFLKLIYDHILSFIFDKDIFLKNIYEYTQILEFFFVISNDIYSS